MTTPTKEQLIEQAIQGHAGTRDAMRWLFDQAHAAGREQGLREANVLREILGECYNVITTIDPEDGDEAEQLREILVSIE